MDLKKIDYKGPRYVLPALIFLPLLFITYQVCALVSQSGNGEQVVATDSLNMELPDADADKSILKSKFDAMAENLNGESYSALQDIGADSTELNDDNLYSEDEMNRIDSIRAKRQQEENDLEELRKSLNDMSHENKFADQVGHKRTQEQQEMDAYEQTLRRIQQRNRMAREMLTDNGYDSYEDRNSRNRSRGSNGAASSRGNGSSVGSNAGNMTAGYNAAAAAAMTNGNGAAVPGGLNGIGGAGGGTYSGGSSLPGGQDSDNGKKEKKIEIARKVPSKNADKFNTISENEEIENTLITAMIDETLKVKDGTRIRLKLLDDIIINKIKLPKGTYLYATVTGFGNQRVRATVTSILARNKFIRVSLSIYDNDGMEGFYVPQSAFRDFMKEAAAGAVQQNMNINQNMGSTVNAESMALQALQNTIQSATNAISNNVRRNKAKIKYNTVVYLINTKEEDD